MFFDVDLCMWLLFCSLLPLFALHSNNETLQWWDWTMEGLKLVCDWLNGRKYTCLLSLTDKVSCFKSLGRVTKKNNLWGGGASKVSSAMPFDIFLCLCKLKRKKITFCLREQKNQLCITMVMEIISRKRHFSEPDRRRCWATAPGFASGLRLISQLSACSDKEQDSALLRANQRTQ